MAEIPRPPISIVIPTHDTRDLVLRCLGSLDTPGQEVIGGTSSLDLAAFNGPGLPASAAWPKLTGDWTIATPTLGSFGTMDTSGDSHKDVVSITRSGTLAIYSTPAPSCSPSSSPRFHHDDWNSGDYTTDAVTPGRSLTQASAVVAGVSPSVLATSTRVSTMRQFCSRLVRSRITYS